MIKKDYKKITVAVVKNPNEKNTSFNLLERINDYELFFTNLFHDYFETAIGKLGWALFIIQVQQQAPSFIVEVYLDNKDNFPLFKKTIIDIMPDDMKITLIELKGEVTDYECKLLDDI